MEFRTAALLVFSIMFPACSEKLDNSFDHLQYVCGNDTPRDAKALVLPHSESGTRLSAAEFTAFFDDKAALTPAAVTENGCVVADNQDGYDLVVFTTSSAGRRNFQQPENSETTNTFTLSLATMHMDRSKWLACGFFPAAENVTDDWAIFKTKSDAGFTEAPDDLRVAWDLDGKTRTWTRSENGCIAVLPSEPGFVSIVKPSGNLAARKFVSGQDGGLLQEITLNQVKDAARFLECGSFSDETIFKEGGSSQTVKLLTPDGVEIPDVSRLSARYGNGSHSFSERGCIHVTAGTNGPVTVRYDLGSSVWGIPDLKKVSGVRTSLTAFNQGDIAPACESVLATGNSALTLPLAMERGGSFEIFSIRAAILDQGRQIKTEKEWTTERSPDFSVDVSSLPDGQYQLQIEIENLLKAGTALTRPVSAVCSVIIDRTAPKISAVSPGPRVLDDNITATWFSPGQAISFRSDTEAGSIVENEYCLIKNPEPGETEQPCVWQRFSDQISAPGSGYWTLRYRSRDQAGNAMAPEELTFLVYHEAEIEVIRTLLTDVKSSLMSGRNLYAMEQALRAESLRRSLPTKIERDILANATREALLNSGAELYQLNYVSLENTVNVTAFHPDSQRFVSAGTMGEVNLHDVSGKNLGQIVSVGSPVQTLTFNNEGSRIAVCTNDRKLRIYSFPEGEEIATAKPGKSFCTELRFTSDDKKLLVTHQSKEAFVLDAEILEQKIKFEGHTDPVWALTLTPDQKTVITADNGGVVRLWDIETGAETRSIQAGGIINSLATSTDGTALYVGGDVLTRWSLTDPNQPKAFVGNYHTAEMRVSSDDDTLYVGQMPGCINVIKTIGESGQLSTCVNISPDGRPWSVSLSRDNKFLITAGYDNKVRIWDAKSRYTRFFHHGGAVKDIHIERDFSIMLSVGSPGHVGVFSIADGNSGFTTLSLGAINAIDFVSAGQYAGSFITAGDDGMSYLFKIEAGVPAVVPLGDATVRMMKARIFKASERVAVGDFNGNVRIWDFSGTQQAQINAHAGEVSVLQLTDNEQALITGGSDSKIHFWNLADNTLIRTIADHSQYVSSVNFHPTRKMAATTSHSGHVILWDTTNWTKLNEWQAHNSCLQSAVFHPVTELIMTTSCDTTVRHWNYEGKLLTTFDAHSCGVVRGAFDVTGTHMMTASCDGSIRIWDLDVDRQIVSGCQWLANYLDNNTDADPKVREFCRAAR